MPTTQFIYHLEPLANISCWNKPVFSAQVKASFQTTAVQLRTLSRIFTFAKPVLCRCQSPSISAATGCTDDGVEGHNAGLTHCCAPGIGDFIGFLTFLWKSWEGLGYSSVRLNRFKGLGPDTDTLCHPFLMQVSKIACFEALEPIRGHQRNWFIYYLYIIHRNYIIHPFMTISVSWCNLHQSSRMTHEHPLSCKPEMVVSPVSETSNRSRICVGCTMKFLTTDFSIRSCKMHQNANLACGLSTCETNILLQRDFLDLGSK